MENLEFKENCVEISLGKNFYSKEALEKTKDAFSRGFRVKVKEDEEKFTVRLSSSGTNNLERAGYQFLNYLLSLMKREESKANL